MCINSNAVVVGENIAKNDALNLLTRQLVRRDLIDFFLLERGEKTLHPRVVKAVPHTAEALGQAAVRKLRTKGSAGVLASAI